MNKSQIPINPIKEKACPRLNELVICKFNKKTELGIICNLVEYKNIEATLNLENFENVGQLKNLKNFVAIVQEVDNKRGLLDISLNIEEEENKKAMKNFIDNKAAHSLLIGFSKKTGIPIEKFYEDFGWKKSKEYGNLLNFLRELKESDFESPYKAELIEIFNQKNKQTKVKYKATVMLKSPKGLIHLQNCLSLILKNKNIEIFFVRSPTYEIFFVGKFSENLKKEFTEILKNGEDFLTEKGGQFDLMALEVC